MNYIEYLEILQKKYGTSNTELLRALGDSGHAISKSNLTHKLKGQRRLTEEELEIIIQTVCPTGTEESRLRELFRIHQFGEEKYASVETVQAYLSRISDSITVNFPPPDCPLSEIGSISTEPQLHQVVYAVLEQGWGEQIVRIQCPANFRRMIDALLTLGSRMTAPVRHLICLNNETGEKQNLYNTHCLFTVAEPAWKNSQYAVRFFYENAGSYAGFYTVYPYFIVTRQHLLLIAHDCRSGILLHQENVRRCYEEEFDRIFAAAFPLMERYEGWLSCMQQSAAQERKCTEKFYVFQRSFNLLGSLDIPLLEKYLDPDLPFRSEIIALQKHRLAEKNPVRGCVLYVSDDMQNLLQYGTAPVSQRHMLLRLQSADRKRAAKCLSSPHFSNRLVRGDFPDISPDVAIICYDNGTVFLVHGGEVPVYLSIRERKLYLSFRTFFDYLLQFAGGTDQPES